MRARDSRLFYMILGLIPLEIVSLIYFLLGPYSQSQFRKICKSFHEVFHLDDALFEESGVLRVWNTYQMWKSEESSHKDELKWLLLDQPSFQLYSRYLVHGVQPNFDPYAPFGVPFVARMKDLIWARPVFNLPKVDPEVLAILVSMYPEEMLTKQWYSWDDTDISDMCGEFLLRSFISDKRAKQLLKAVFTAHPISIQGTLLIHSTTVYPDYLKPEIMCMLLKRSYTGYLWDSRTLELLAPLIQRPKAMKLFFQVSPDRSMCINTSFLCRCLKLGITIVQLFQKAKIFYFRGSKELSESKKQILLHSCVGEESYVMSYMSRHAFTAECFTWTNQDDHISTVLGYSDSFRTHMRSLHNPAPRGLLSLLQSYFN